MYRKGVIAVICLLFVISAVAPLYAREPMHRRGKNLYRLVEGKTLKVYLGSIESETEKISPEEFRRTLKNLLLGRHKERFVITDSKESAKIIINAKILNFKYLEEDPVDQIVGGLSALLVDAAVTQNYARVDAEFTVIKAKDGKRIWHREFYTTVTESDMPEPESIPKVLKECCKRFVFLCFGKPKR